MGIYIVPTLHPGGRGGVLRVPTKRVLMGVPTQLTTIFLANSQLTTNFG